MLTALFVQLKTTEKRENNKRMKKRTIFGTTKHTVDR